MKISPRNKKLLQGVADSLKNDCSPMNHNWLCDNEVTLNECGALSDLCAVIIQGYIHAPETVRTQLIVAGCCDDAGTAAMLSGVIQRNNVLQQLKDVCRK